MGAENSNESLELERAKKLKADLLGQPESKPKRRKLKGPNPLSIKKKKKKQVPNTGGVPGAFGVQLKDTSVFEKDADRNNFKKKRLKKY